MFALTIWVTLALSWMTFGEFTTEILLTTDLPEGKKLSGIGFEYVFIPDYLAP